MRTSKPVIIVHGGAGDWPSELHKKGLKGVRAAADRGFRVLFRGGSALDAVQVAIVTMEDNPVFNAGRGSTLNLAGEVETDAAIMDGNTLRGAGVEPAALQPERRVDARRQMDRDALHGPLVEQRARRGRGRGRRT